LAAVFGLFVPRAQTGLRTTLKRHPGSIWAFPFLLTGVFAAAAGMAGAFGLPLIAMVLGYTLAPVACVVLGADFAAILFLWLPLEFAAGAHLVPRPAQGFLHSVAYGVAILLGLVLFLGYRALPGMKYNLPRDRRDWLLPPIGFAIVAPVLILVGVAIG